MQSAQEEEQLAGASAAARSQQSSTGITKKRVSRSLRPLVLDRLNEGNFLNAIAGCGGLVSAHQFEALMGKNQSAARRAYHTLAEGGMAYLLRAARNSCFILLSKRTVEALGSDHPAPPQPKAVRMTTYQLAIARAQYFISIQRIPRPTSDLSSAKHKGARTLRLVGRAIVSQHKVIQREIGHLEAGQALSREQLSRLEKLKQQLRDPRVVLKAGAAALRYRRGLFVLQPKGARITFVFVDRVTQVRSYTALIAMLGRFADATGLRTHLDIVCGSERSKQRVSLHFGQTELRVRLRILNLDYDRYMGSGLDLPELVSPDAIGQLLCASGEGSQ